MPPSRHLPAAHLRPPHNWINDPNGLSFHDGHYHVFFQYNPHAPRHADVHWGHFRSRDLLTWEQLPIALTPTPGGEDADGCFSGNAISDGDRLIAFYSANRRDRWNQPITTAESRDGGRTFDKRGALLIREPPAGCTMYRDPYVWRDGDRWRMLVGAALAGSRAAALLYESPELETWTYQGHFCASEPQIVGGIHRGTGGGWECPQYLSADGRRGALIVSAWNHDGGPQRVIALVGEDHDGTFQPGPPMLLDHGPDCYAPALLRAPGGRWLLWGWAWEARDDEWAVEDGWAGVLTVPREITITEEGSLHQQPAAELLGLRGQPAIHCSGDIASPEPLEVGELPRSFDLNVRLDASGSAGLRLLTRADGSEYLDIQFDPQAGELVVDRSHASMDRRAHGGSYLVPCPAHQPVELRLVVDRSIAEVFLSTGQVLTLRFYPTGDDPWRLHVRTEPGTKLKYTAEAWHLQPLVYSATTSHTC